MSARARVAEALLPALRSVFPEAAEGDLLFFGEEADIASPLPRKSGVDSPDNMVYNVLYEAYLKGVRLLSGARTMGGFIEMTVSDDALFVLCKEAAASADTEPDYLFEVGPCPGFVRAGLLTAAAVGEEEFSVPADPALRRALWSCLMADSPSQRRIALRLAYSALGNNRKERQLCRTAALAMAAAFENKNWS